MRVILQVDFAAIHRVAVAVLVTREAIVQAGTPTAKRGTILTLHAYVTALAAVVRVTLEENLATIPTIMIAVREAVLTHE